MGFLGLFGKKKSASEMAAEKSVAVAEQRKQMMKKLEMQIKRLHLQMETANGRAKERLAEQIQKLTRQQTKLQEAK